MTHCGGSDAGSKQGWEHRGEGQGRLPAALRGGAMGQGSPLCQRTPPLDPLSTQPSMQMAAGATGPDFLLTEMALAIFQR